MNIAKFKTDGALENEGVWLEVGDGLSLRVARIGNRKHSELWTKLNADPKIVRMASLGTIPDEEYERMLIEAMAETILLDWKGLTDGDGEAAVEIPFSKAKAKEVLKLRDFRQLVHRMAAEAGNFRAEQVEAAAGELKKN